MFDAMDPNHRILRSMFDHVVSNRALSQGDQFWASSQLQEQTSISPGVSEALEGDARKTVQQGSQFG